jgi:hypothetical protein
MTAPQAGAAGASEVAQPQPAASARRCVNHPHRETLVACGRCEQPFCPQCLVYTPAGQRCYACAGVRRHAAGQAAAVAMAKVFATAAIGSLIAGLLGSFLIQLFAALATGAVAGTVLAPSINRRTRRPLYALGFAALAAGALLGWLAPLAVRLTALPASVAGLVVIAAIAAVLQSLVFWLFIVVAAAVAYQRMR